MGVTCIKTAKKPSYLQQSIPDAEKRAAKTQGVGDSGSIKRMQEELEGLRNEIAKKNRDQLDMMYNLDMDNFSEDTRAYFQTNINGNEAKWKAYAEWKTATSESIATIEGRVTENESNINILSQWQSETTNSIATIRQTANSAYSQVESLTNWRGSDGKNITDSLTSIKQTSDSASSRIDLLVETTSTGNSRLNSSAASIIMEAINDDTSSIKISADKIQLSGETEFITAADLSDNGSTVVSGNRISLVTNLNSASGISSLAFKIRLPSKDDAMGYIDGGDIGTGAEDDARFRIRLLTEEFTYSGKTYKPAIYLTSVGGVSITSNGDPSGIYIGSFQSYITLDATENTRIRASRTYWNMGNTGAMAVSTKDYVFCTDGIYYNGINICPTNGNSSTTQEVQS